MNIWVQRLVWAVFFVRERRYLYHLHSKQRVCAAGVDKENILVLVKGPLLQQLEKSRKGLTGILWVCQNALRPGQTADRCAAIGTGDGIAGAKAIVDMNYPLG